MTERKRALRDAETAVRGTIESYVERGVDRQYADNWHDDLDDVLADLRTVRALTAEQTVTDRMPPGANSPAGPDDGRSTGWADLAATLDERAAEVAVHPWFAANPHWAFDLHDEGAALEHLRTT